jgi:chromosome partitioning protein
MNENKNSILKKENFIRSHLSQTELGKLINKASGEVGIFLKKAGIPTIENGSKAFVNRKDIRCFLELLGVKYPKKLFSVQMLKGGVGKTSIAFNIAIRLYQYGFKVLVIDLDPQANLTQLLLKKDYDNQKLLKIYHYLNANQPLDKIILPIEDELDLVPSSFDNAQNDIYLSIQNKSLNKIFDRDFKQAIKKYDIVIFDTNPSLSKINLATALTVDTIITPLNPDQNSIHGFSLTYQVLRSIFEDCEKELNLSPIFTFFNSREILSNEYTAIFLRQFPQYGNVFKVPRSIDFEKSESARLSIFEFSKSVESKNVLDDFIINLVKFSEIFTTDFKKKIGSILNEKKAKK